MSKSRPPGRGPGLPVIASVITKAINLAISSDPSELPGMNKT